MQRLRRDEELAPYKCDSCNMTVIGKGDLGGWKPINLGTRTAWFCDKVPCRIASDEAMGRHKIEMAGMSALQGAPPAAEGTPVFSTQPTLTSVADPGELERKLSDMTIQKDGAYAERNRCVIGLCRLAMALGYQTGMGEHNPDDENWDAEWRGIVYIDLPVGQVSWHIHDSERGLFEFLPPYVGKWDGHDTATKYRRVMQPGAGMGKTYRDDSKGVVVGETEGQSTAPKRVSLAEEVSRAMDRQVINEAVAKIEAEVSDATELEATVEEVTDPAAASVSDGEPVGRPTAKFGKKLVTYIQENGWDDESILMKPAAYPQLDMERIDPEILRDGINSFFVGVTLVVGTIERVVMEGLFVGLRFTLVKG